MGGCDPVAVDGSPGPRGRGWVTSSVRKEDLETQSAHFTAGQNEATGAMPALASHTWLEVIAFLPLLPACGQSFPRWILVWKQKAAWRRVENLGHLVGSIPWLPPLPLPPDSG